MGPRRRAVAATLEAATAQLPGPGVSTRPSEQGTFVQRVLDPVARTPARLICRLSPPGYIESVRRRLTIAGRGQRIALDRFLAGRLATIALIPVAVIGIDLAGLPKLYRLLTFILALVALLLGPEAQLNRAAEARQDRIVGTCRL